MAQVGQRELFAIAGAGIMAIGLLLHIIGLATPNWELFGQGYANVGLWGGCVQSVCTTYAVKSSEIKACEAFAIIGCLLGAGGLGLALFHSFMVLTGKPKNLMFPSLSALAGCLACGAVIIVVSVWGGKVHDDNIAKVYVDAELGSSFILSIIGGAFMGGGGVFVFLVSRIQS